MGTEAMSKGREERWQRRLALPALVAALVSIPAVFLTLFDGHVQTAGSVLNTASGVVLIGETCVLFLVAEDKWGWLKRHLWLVLLAALILVGTLLALGPLQLFRLLRLVGTLRILRAGRILKAGRLVAGRVEGRWNQFLAIGVSVLVAVFVTITLADPTSSTRTLIENVIPLQFGPVTIALAGLALAVATFFVVFDRQSRTEEGTAEPEDDRDPVR